MTRRRECWPRGSAPASCHALRSCGGRDGDLPAHRPQPPPVRDAKGRITGTVIVFRDATEQRFPQRGGRREPLAEAGDARAASLDAEATLAAAARVAVPRLADWCAVYLRG